MINIELAKRLKDKGFPLRKMPAEKNDEDEDVYGIDGFYYYPPTLSELVEACGDRFDFLANNRNGLWQASGRDVSDCYASSAEATVATLWLALQEDKK